MKNLMPFSLLLPFFQVVGLGPRMKILIILENLSQNIIQQGLKITFIFDSKIYNINKPVIKVHLFNVINMSNNNVNYHSL